MLILEPVGDGALLCVAGNSVNSKSISSSLACVASPDVVAVFAE